MKVLITGGATMTMIDKVRGITNIFRGTTAHKIAENFSKLGHDVTLLTSNKAPITTCHVEHFKTYDDLLTHMTIEVIRGNYDVIIHSAAISDYKVEGVYEYHLNNRIAGDLQRVDSTGKIPSQKEELFMKLIPTEKIVDKIRIDWNFKGILVKFKLQVGMSDEELIDIATKSMHDSKADMIVANCLEWCNEYAYLITDNYTEKVSRDFLPIYLRLKLENIIKGVV